MFGSFFFEARLVGIQVRLLLKVGPTPGGCGWVGPAEGPGKKIVFFCGAKKILPPIFWVLRGYPDPALGGSRPDPPPGS